MQLVLHPVAVAREAGARQLTRAAIRGVVARLAPRRRRIGCWQSLDGIEAFGTRAGAESSPFSASPLNRSGVVSALSKADIVRNLFAAYLAEDRDAVEGIFADDFCFTSPFDDRLDKAGYFARCWRGSGWIAQHALERIVIDGDCAIVTYRVVTTDGKSFRNTEVMTFDGERIAAIEVYFGATYRNGAFVPMPSD